MTIVLYKVLLDIVRLRGEI